MKPFINDAVRKFANWAIFASGALCVGVAYAALSSGLTASDLKSAGNQVSSASWNRIVNSVLELDWRTAQISTSGWNTWIWTATPTQTLSVAGTVESTSWGFKFPDGTVQTSATSGKILNVTIKNDCTRVAMGASPMTMTTFTVDKKSATSTLLIQGSIAGWGNYSGDLTQGWKLGTSAEAIWQPIMYESSAYSKIYSTSAVIAGYATTGPQTMTFRYFSQNGATAEKPFLVYNPNSSDQARIGQTCSVYTVWEIGP